MNPTHIHLLLNHFPIIGTLIGGMIFIVGWLKKSQHLTRAGAVVLVIMALVAIPVYLTGEPAEESVEKLAGVSEQLIEAHEDAAGIALSIMMVTAIASLLYLIGSWMNRNWAGKLSWLVSIMALISFASMARTGYLGGQIRHTEIRSGMVQGERGINNAGENDREHD